MESKSIKINLKKLQFFAATKAAKRINALNQNEIVFFLLHENTKNASKAIKIYSKLFTN